MEPMPCLTSQPAVSPSGGDGDLCPLTCNEAEQPPHCLYFLVCAASTGDLTGLFKLGITNHLPTRYRQHTRIWDEFDLDRSAVLWLDSRRAVECLEGMLKDLFKKWQRYPGRDDIGCTEFFAVEGLPEVLDTVEVVGVRVLGGRLSRRIDPADCATSSRADGMSALARKEQGELIAQRNALQRQERAEQGDHITLELEWLHDFVEAVADHLVWVNLDRWYGMPILKAPETRKDKTLVDLYFGHFHPEEPYIEAAEQLPGTQASFERSVRRVQRSAVRTHSSLLSRYCPPAMFHLRKPLVHPGDQLPHPVCVDTLLLRVECGRCIPPYPFLAKFEALAQQVGSVRRMEQLAFGL